MNNASTRSASLQPANSTIHAIITTKSPPIPPPKVIIDIANVRLSRNQVAIAVRPT